MAEPPTPHSTPDPLRFSTAQIPSKNRIEYWEAHNAKALIGLDIRTLEDTPLMAEEINLHLPALRFAGVKGSSQIVERSARMIAAHPTGDIAIFFAMSGDAFFYHSKGTILLKPGQAVVYDADRPFVRGFSHGLYELVLTIPREDFAHLSGGRDLNEPLVFEFGSDLRRRFPNPSATDLVSVIDSALRRSPDDLYRVEQETFELVERMLSPMVDSGREARYRHALQEIERHFGDGALNRAKVAAAIGVSERQLSRIFAAQDETFADHLQNYRLQIAETILASEPHTTVAEIARRCGFASPSHFSRVFKARTGLTPLELQRATEF
ncbi:AraC family transcriptional regulator [Brevibacterium aurantiacum]|uniref:AraC family transcriptional regulator n=1 Tax=Brevibacterium aurantiacum TaxID=273384 RepID=A0A3T0DLE4_BREAU|nr:helix-turn-helix domain-containing protein [Brevibacterium aurantiacum]AZT95886.1 AraC family transcriptional regulator [Brevibacterium aurantiacum]